MVMSPSDMEPDGMGLSPAQPTAQTAQMKANSFPAIGNPLQDYTADSTETLPALC